MKDKPKYSRIPDRVLSIGVMSIYIFLGIFGIISLIGPDWFMDLTEKGKTDEVYVMLYYADGLSQSGRTDDALELYNEVLKLDPLNVKALTNKAINYLHMDNPGMAREFLYKALETGKGNPDLIYFYVAEIDYSSGFKMKAADSYKKSASYSPFPIYQYRKLANLYFEQKDWKNASQYYQLALANKSNLENSYRGMLKRDIELFPDREDIIEILRAQLNNDEYKKQLDVYDTVVFNKMIGRDRSIALDLNRLGYCYTVDNQYNTAAQCFKKAIDIWPGYTEAKRNLALAREKIKESE